VISELAAIKAEISASLSFRLDETTYGLKMTLRDDAGNVAAILSYRLQDKPDGFDLSRLAEAWARWRGASTIAS
jgi:hypothetical protein